MCKACHEKSSLESQRRNMNISAFAICDSPVTSGESTSPLASNPPIQSFMHSFIHSFNKQSLSPYLVPSLCWVPT